MTGSGQRTYLFAGILTCGASMAAAVYFGAPTQPSAPLRDALVQERPQVPDFKLSDASGKSVARDDIRGPWVASFMFADCGTQCPMMTAKLSQLSRRMPNVSFVSFSVDPADTPAKLKRYAQAYRADWLFLTGGPGEVRKLSIEGFKLPVADGTSEGEALIHSKNLVLVDKEGRIRGYYDSDDADSIRRLVSDASKI